MKIYIQTETHTPNAPVERRGRQLVLETTAPADKVQHALAEIMRGLGEITAVPAAPHEHNLKQILPRDLAALGIAAGLAGDAAAGMAVLEIHRTPGQTGSAGQADVTALRYVIHVQ